MVRYGLPLYLVGWFAKYGNFNRWYLDMSSNLRLVFKFWYNKSVHKNLGGPSLGLYVCIYTSLHNVNIVWLIVLALKT